VRRYAQVGFPARVATATGSRWRAGLTQTEVARRMGTTQSGIARFESGDSDPRLSTVERYAQVVGVDLRPEVRVA
jgi:predicted transcriptional regulator